MPSPGVSQPFGRAWREDVRVQRRGPPAGCGLGLKTAPPRIGVRIEFVRLEVPKRSECRTGHNDAIENDPGG